MTRVINGARQTAAAPPPGDQGAEPLKTSFPAESKVIPKVGTAEGNFANSSAGPTSFPACLCSGYVALLPHPKREATLLLQAFGGTAWKGRHPPHIHTHPMQASALSLELQKKQWFLTMPVPSLCPTSVNPVVCLSPCPRNTGCVLNHPVDSSLSGTCFL